MGNLQESGEMYLETILVLSKTNEKVRSIDVSNYMGYSKPSVSRAVGLLKQDGYIEVTSGGALVLTDLGRETAQTIYDRHVVLTDSLIRLGMDEVTAAADACRIEHVISQKSFEAIRRHLESVTDLN